MAGVASGLIEAALPAACPHCGGRLAGFDIGLCAACRAGLRPDLGSRCPRCATPGPTSSSDCLACEEDAPPQSATVAWATYEGPVRSAVLALKHRAHDEMARSLGRALAAVISTETWAERLDAVTFVPSHPLRRLRCGPAAAHELARAVGTALDRPTVRLMVRRGLGRQAARSRAQRMRLGAHVFRAVTPVPERVLLVDDVLTTGTTLRRAVHTLLTAGAAEVFCGVVARTPDSRRPT